MSGGKEACINSPPTSGISLSVDQHKSFDTAERKGGEERRRRVTEGGGKGRNTDRIGKHTLEIVMRRIAGDGKSKRSQGYVRSMEPYCCYQTDIETLAFHHFFPLLLSFSHFFVPFMFLCTFQYFHPTSSVLRSM